MTIVTSTPLSHKKSENRDQSSLDIIVDNKKGTFCESLDMFNIEPSVTDDLAVRHIQLSRDDLVAISNQLHETFSADMEAMVKCVAQSVLPQVIDGVIATLTDTIDRLIIEYQRLHDDVRALQLQAGCTEQYSKRNCLRITCLSESSGENTDQLVLDMAKSLGSQQEIDRSHRLGPHIAPLPSASQESASILTKSRKPKLTTT